MFLLLMQKSTLSRIYYKFLLAGHARMECDTDHSVLEKNKSKYGALVPPPCNWSQLVRSWGKKILFKFLRWGKTIFLILLPCSKNNNIVYPSLYRRNLGRRTRVTLLYFFFCELGNNGFIFSLKKLVFFYEFFSIKYDINILEFISTPLELNKNNS